MKFITNDRREGSDLIELPQRHEIATSLCSSQRMGSNKADVVRSARPLGVKNADIRYKLDNKQRDVQDIAKNHAIKLISLKRNESVGSFYELFSLNAFVAWINKFPYSAQYQRVCFH